MPLRRKKPMRRPRKPMARGKRHMRRQGRVGRRKSQDKSAAKDFYFRIHGWVVDGEQVARCQICGDPLLRSEADACHKVRSSQSRRRATGNSGEDPRNLLAGHRLCHSWMDARKERERVAIASPANCADGGVVEWPAEMLESLRAWKRSFNSPIPLGEIPGALPPPARGVPDGQGSGDKKEGA